MPIKVDRITKWWHMPVMEYNTATKIKGIRTTCNNVENYINTVLSEISNPRTVGPKPGKSDCRTPSVRQMS